MTGFRNPAMIEVAARHKAPVVLMHMRGTPKTMQEDISYGDVVADLKAFFVIAWRKSRKKAFRKS